MAPNLYTSVQPPRKSPKSPPSIKFRDLHLHSQVQIYIYNPAQPLKSLVVAILAKTALGVADSVPAGPTAAFIHANSFRYLVIFPFTRAVLLALSVLCGCICMMGDEGSP
jgi:hypothetical protein